MVNFSKNEVKKLNFGLNHLKPKKWNFGQLNVFCLSFIDEQNEIIVDFAFPNKILK